MIGNPGAGKSTLLNCLAGESLFQSGQSYGEGLTKDLGVRIHNGLKYFDTPGLADRVLRKEAGRAITEALREGGKYKILFFVRLESGRPVNEDITTMKLVLDAAPEIGKKYGVMIPKITPGVVERLKGNEMWTSVYAGIFNGCKYFIHCIRKNLKIFKIFYSHRSVSKDRHCSHAWYTVCGKP